MALTTLNSLVPDRDCLIEAASYAWQGCRCDSNVVPLAQGLGLQPGQFYTLGRAGQTLHEFST